MKKEEEEKVQGIGSGVVGNWTLRKTRRDATQFEALCLLVFIHHASRR